MSQEPSEQSKIADLDKWANDEVQSLLVRFRAKATELQIADKAISSLLVWSFFCFGVKMAVEGGFPLSHAETLVRDMYKFMSQLKAAEGR